MKKTMITTAALGLLAVTASGSMVSADMISGTTNKTDVTLTEGSGTDVTPVVPDDTHDDDPSTGDVGSLSIPFASNITFGQHEIQQRDMEEQKAGHWELPFLHLLEKMGKS